MRQVTENQEVMNEQPLTAEQSNVLSTLYTEGYDYVFNYLRKCVNNSAKAESLTSDVFNKIANLLKNENTAYDVKKSSVITYCHTVAKHVLIDSTRTNVGYNKNTSKVSDFVDSEGNEYLQFEATKTTNADNEILTAELRTKIARAFKGIKHKTNRQAGILYFIQGYNLAETANILDIPVNTVKGAINRIRKVLMVELQTEFA